MNDNAEFLPSFAEEADALARVIALAFDATRDLRTPAEPDVSRLINEALEHAYLAGRESR